MQRANPCDFSLPGTNTTLLPAVQFSSAMNQHHIPTFFMGHNDSIDNEGKVLFATCGDKLHVLHNEATLHITSAVVDDEMSEIRDHFAAVNVDRDHFYSIGDADEPLITRMWRARVFAWSFKNNMWQLAESHTDLVKAIMTTKGLTGVAHTPVGEAFLKLTEET